MLDILILPLRTCLLEGNNCRRTHLAYALVVVMVFQVECWTGKGRSGFQVQLCDPTVCFVFGRTL